MWVSPTAKPIVSEVRLPAVTDSTMTLRTAVACLDVKLARKLTNDVQVPNTNVFSPNGSSAASQ
jgi:hypothetical protein